MPAFVPFRLISPAASLLLVPLLLVACGDGAQPQLAEPLRQAYRMLEEMPRAEGDGCAAAPAMVQALDGWLQAVEEAGLSSQFTTETTEVRQRMDAIRGRCADAMASAQATSADGKRRPRASAQGGGRASNEDPRPTLTPDLLDAYIRGVEEEIVLMRATGSHFISLSMYSEEDRRVAEKAGLELPEYRGLRRAVDEVLYAHLMHERYAGADGQARLARLEPHKREHAIDMLASEPFAPLSPAERDAVQARLDTLRPLYDRYMEIAAIAD